MASSKKNRKLFIDKEGRATLALAQEGILGSVDKLMNEEEAMEVNRTGHYKGSPMPFPFILAPAGKENEKVIKSVQKGEVIDFCVDKNIVGQLVAEDSFKIDKEKRVKKVFGSYDPDNRDIKLFLKRLGDYSISGKFHVEYPHIKEEKKRIEELKKELNAKTVAALMIGVSPFHRAHERLMRVTLDKSDMVVVFLMRPYRTDGIPYAVRHKSIEYFIENYLPKNRVIVVPFENTYIFRGNNNLILQSIVAKNYGCNKLVIGQNHIGIGLYFDENQSYSSLDKCAEELSLDAIVLAEFVFCNECKTLVSTKTCPHGSHHHIKYHGKSLERLLKLGILPPALFMRKEISSYILSELFPKRFKNIQGLYDDLFPNKGLLEEHSEEDFYLELMKLYQTTSLV